MKAKVQELAGSGAEGPTGRYQELVDAGSIPAELPCEAFGLWGSDGILYAAKSADGMNGWYFHLDMPADETPIASEQTYEAEDNTGVSHAWLARPPARIHTHMSVAVHLLILLQAAVTVSEGAKIAEAIAGTSRCFFINGERFTFAGVKNHTKTPLSPLVLPSPRPICLPFTHLPSLHIHCAVILCRIKTL